MVGPVQIDVRFPCADGHAMGGVLTMPDAADGRRPALLLIYELLGMNEPIREVARDLAREGWVVLVPDLFDRELRAVCIAKALRAIATGRGAPLDDLEAARAWLAARPEVDGERIGVIGFCMGGGFALLLATNPRYRAAAPFYGQVPAEMPRSCPVVASYGGKDRRFAAQVPRLEESLATLGVPHDVKIYPDAGHSFFTRTPGGLLGRVMLGTGAGHHGPSAKDARARVVAFFREHL